jgi:polyferredoxin
MPVMLVGVRSRVGLLVLIACLLIRSSAFADGEHGSVTTPERATPSVTIQGFRVGFLTDPTTVSVGREARIIARIEDQESASPLRGGEVFIGLKPIIQMGTRPQSPAQDASGLLPSPEETWAGHYTARLTPREAGPYLARIAIVQLAGRRFDPPIIVDFQFAAVASSWINTGLILFSAIALTTAGAGVWAFGVRRRYGWSASRLDLLEVPWLRKALLSKLLQPSLQIPLLVLMIAVTVLGFLDTQDGEKNLATQLVWTLWWPGIIFTFILVGRLWCFMCPFGALNEWPSRLVKPTRLFPRAIRNLWPATGLFVLLTLLDEQLGVFDSPRATAWIIVFFALLALGIGLLYQRRSFCRYVCPIGGMIGIYSMLAPVELRAKSRAVCRADSSKACYRGSDAAYGCPMFEFPLAMDRNTYCNLCFECVKACPKENLSLRLRPFGQDLWTTVKRPFDESYFAIVLVGVTTIVTAQMLPAWDPFISWLAGFLGPIRGWVKPVTYLTMTEAAVFLVGSLVVFPLLLVAGARLADRTGGKNVKGTFVLFCSMFIPIALGMHLSHNLSHLFMEGPGIVPAVQRLVKPFAWLGAGEPVWEVTPLLGTPVIFWLQVALLFLSFAFSIKVGQRLVLNFYDEDAPAGRILVPMVALACLFTVVNFYLISLPMGFRHGT